MLQYIKPFASGFAQVFLVTATTYFIANGQLAMASCSSFFISLVWTFNVRHALANWPIRIVYCLGAATGTAVGFLFAQIATALS
jgi:hypothetical protein